MSEYLEKKCVNLGIRLVYTYNKTTVLSAEINKEKPLIIADMLFKNCPDSVSQAILGFFTDLSKKSYYENTIRSFVEDFFKPYTPGKIKHFDLSYLIKSAESINSDDDDDYEEEVKEVKHDAKPEADDYEDEDEPEYTSYKVKHKDDDYKIKFDMDNIDTSKIDVNDPNLLELGIYHIEAKDFWGGEKQYNSNTSIKPLKDEELQLNIVVLPPGT